MVGGLVAFLAPLAYSSDRFPVYWTGPQGELFRAAGGDVDGDGMADVVLLSWVYFVSPASPQHAFVRSGLNGSLLRTWTPSVPSMYGFQAGPVKPAGDLNLDGFGDVALSILNPVLLSSVVEVRSGLDGSVIALIPPPAVSNALSIGSPIAGVGDLDGDGWPELLIRGDHQVPGCAVGHGVYDFEAGGGGFLLQYYVTAWQCSQEFGTQIGRVDDVDGDGLADFYVGAPRTAVAGIYDAGWIGVFSGVTGSLITSLGGSTQNEYLGGSVAALSDVTGDGNPELLVRRGGGPNDVVLLSLPSFATVYALPAASMAGAGGAIMEVDAPGDVDGDGMDDFLVRWRTAQFSEGVTAFSGPTGTPLGQVAQGFAGGALYPFGAVGDVNGDGLGDFATTPWGPAAIPPGPVPVLSPWSPSYSPMTSGVTTVRVARNFDVVGTPAVAGAAQFQVVAPKHAGRPFQVVFSQDWVFPPFSLGPFLFSLVPDGLFWASLAAGIGGTLNGTGHGAVTVPIPNDPALHGAIVLASGVVYDPGGPLGIGCVLTHVGFQIQ